MTRGLQKLHEGGRGAGPSGLACSVVPGVVPGVVTVVDGGVLTCCGDQAKNEQERYKMHSINKGQHTLELSLLAPGSISLRTLK